MSSLFHRTLPAFLFVAVLLPCAAIAAGAQPAEIRVCSDPNNLPFSNDREEGFENEIASLLSRVTHAPLRYTWWAQRRGFVRNTLKAGTCDIIVGIPAGFEMAATTSPYYRSSYVFVRRRGDTQVRSFDDPLLRSGTVGIPIIGDDFANAPPAHALSARGMVSNVRGFTVYGDYSRPNPPARILDALVGREIDTAIVWGPLAGFFISKRHLPLQFRPVSPQVDLPFLPFVFDISMGVRRGDDALKSLLEKFLSEQKPEIDAILRRFGVPRIDIASGGAI